MTTTTLETTDQRVPLLAARSLSVGYGTVPAVREIDVEVHPGEVVALLGANGAGKTTTLLGLAGELAPMSGEVHWLGSKTTAPLHKRARQGLALVPEERSVISSLSVRDNLRLGRGDVSYAVELAPELRPLLRRRAGSLSGGEQQILTLTRALAGAPRALLADELSLGLAPIIVTRVLAIVRAAASDQGVGVLLVEQHIQQALAVADRAYVLRRGRVVMEGTAASLRERSTEIESHYLSGVVEDQ